jgi:hypothetical protein
MAISNGRFGELSGKIGNLVSYNLKGKNVVRRIGKNNKPPTVAQLAVRQKIAAVNKFLRATLGVINAGFELEVAGTYINQHNAATSYHMKNATQGEYPNISVDYSKVLISKGDLEPAINPGVTIAGTTLTLTWELSEGITWSIKNDRVMMLIYCPELNLATYVLSGTRRSSGKDDIALPPNYIDKELHIYIAFKASNGERISNSVHLLPMN